MTSTFYINILRKLTLGLICLTLTSPISLAFETRAILVTATQPTLENWSQQITAQGAVRPWQVAIISNKTNGIDVTKINAFEGDTVSKGQVLIEFDNRMLTAELNQKKADVELAQANLDLATLNFERFKKPEFRKTISQQEFDMITNQMAVAKANKAKMKAAQTIAELRLADATVISPEDGVILERTIDLGQVSQPGAALFKLLRQNKLEWIAEVNAEDLTNIQKGMTAQINSVQGEITGKVSIISSQLSNQTRLANIHVLLDKQHNVAVNSYYTGIIITGDSEALVIPANAVVIKDGKTYVFHINKGKAHQKLVQLGRRQIDKIEVLSGLQKSDLIALDGAGFLNNGDDVAIQKSTNNTSQVGRK